MAFNTFTTIQYYASIKGSSASCTRTFDAVAFPFIISDSEFGVSLLSMGDNQEFSVVCRGARIGDDITCELIDVGGNMEINGQNRTIFHCTLQFGNVEDRSSFLSLIGDSHIPVQ